MPSCNWHASRVSGVRLQISNARAPWPWGNDTPFVTEISPTNELHATEKTSHAT